MSIRRSLLALPFALAILWAQFHESGSPELHARLEITTEPRMPVRLYLFKGERPFRLSPVDAHLPLRVDLFYRERLWTSSANPRTLEVTCRDRSHFILLDGAGSYNLPAGKYRIEAYRGFFYVPVVREFELRSGETLPLKLDMENWAGDERAQWTSADDHIHITRDRADDPVLLKWLEAEDLNVGNFLQLQRQMDAAVQYGFGEDGAAIRGIHAIRSGHESRSEFYGHLNLLGGREMVRPLSVGSMYANSAIDWPHPAVLFARGRKVGATVGYAHFDGSTKHSTLLMDLALGNIDFVEVFQFGVLKTEQWYEVLNAGLGVTGIAGSDFPVPLNRQEDWPRWLPPLGPERALVPSPPSEDPYQTWAKGVREGNAIVTNGPLVRLETSEGRLSATARFYRPIERLEIVKNGQILASSKGDGRQTSLALSANADTGEPAWFAARVTAETRDGEPQIQAHTNPVYVNSEKDTIFDPEARKRLADRWEAELTFYRSPNLNLGTEARKREFLDAAERALELLRGR